MLIFYFIHLKIKSLTEIKLRASFVSVHYANPELMLGKRLVLLATEINTNNSPKLSGLIRFYSTNNYWWQSLIVMSHISQCSYSKITSLYVATFSSIDVLYVSSCDWSDVQVKVIHMYFHGSLKSEFCKKERKEEKEWKKWKAFWLWSTINVSFFWRTWPR